MLYYYLAVQFFRSAPTAVTQFSNAVVCSASRVGDPECGLAWLLPESMPEAGRDSFPRSAHAPRDRVAMQTINAASNLLMRSSLRSWISQKPVSVGNLYRQDCRNFNRTIRSDYVRYAHAAWTEAPYI